MWRLAPVLIFLCLASLAEPSPAGWPDWRSEGDGAWHHASGISLVLPKEWKAQSSDDQVYLNLSEPGPDTRSEPTTRVILKADPSRSWLGPDRDLWLKYLAGEDAARWLPAFSAARWSWLEETLVCQGTPEELAEAEALLRAKDVPPRLSTRFGAFPVEHEQEARERAAGLESWLAGQGKIVYTEATLKLPQGIRGSFRRGIARLGFTDHVNTVGYLSDGRRFLVVYSQIPSGRSDSLSKILRTARFPKRHTFHQESQGRYRSALSEES